MRPFIKGFLRSSFALGALKAALCGLIAVSHLGFVEITEARAELIVAYASQGSGGSLSPTQQGTEVTGRLLERGTGISDAGGSTFNSRGFNGTSLSGAITLDDRLEFGFDSDDEWDLEWLTLLYDRSATGPQRLAILLSLDQGLNWQTVFEDTSVSPNSDDNPSVALDNFQSVTSARFRLYGWNASSSAGTFDLENFSNSPSQAIALSGSRAPPAAVPEPGIFPLLVVGATTAWIARRRRLKSHSSIANQPEDHSGNA